MEMSRLKSNFICSFCSKIFKSPKELPCKDLICQDHLSERSLVKQNKIQCLKCKQEFEIKGGEFASIDFVQKLLDNQVYLSDEEVSLKKKIEESIKFFYEMYDEFILSKTKLDLDCHEHFQEVRRQIDLHRENLKAKIDEIALDMIEKTKESEKVYTSSLKSSFKTFELTKSLDEDLKELEEKFRNPNISMKSIQKLRVNKETTLGDLKSMLIEMSFAKDHLKASYGFTSSLSLIEDSFGSIFSNECSSNDLVQSKILSCSQLQADLMKLCDFSLNSCKWSLLYRGTRDGFGAKGFHSKCDGHTNTLTVLKVGEFVFGGFTMVSWDSSPNQWKADTNAFLFSLVNKDNLPCVMKIDSTQCQFAIRCHARYGPTFGIGHDLRIVNNSNGGHNNDSNLGHTYKHPQYGCGSKEAQAFLAGSCNFKLSEIEIYRKE